MKTRKVQLGAVCELIRGVTFEQEIAERLEQVSPLRRTRRYALQLLLVRWVSGASMLENDSPRA
jgi:hypothetical protein